MFKDVLHGHGLSPGHFKTGCTINILPPFRPECHYADENRIIQHGAAPDPAPDLDVGCEFRDSIIPHCHVRIGGHSVGKAIDDMGEQIQDGIYGKFDEEKEEQNKEHQALPPEDLISMVSSYLSTTLWKSIRTSTGAISSEPSSPGTFQVSSTTQKPHKSETQEPKTSKIETTTSSAPSTSQDASPTVPSEPSSIPTSVKTTTSAATSPSTPGTDPKAGPTKSSKTNLVQTPTTAPGSPSTKTDGHRTKPGTTLKTSTVASATGKSSAALSKTGRPASSTTSPPASSKTSPAASSGKSSWVSSQASSPKSWKSHPAASWPNKSPTAPSKTSSTLSLTSSPAASSGKSSWVSSPASSPTSWKSHPAASWPNKSPTAPSKTSSTLSLTSSPAIVLPTKLVDQIPPEKTHDHVTAVAQILEQEDHRKLALGLSIGLGAGLPAGALVRWFSIQLRTLNTIARGGTALGSVLRAMRAFRLDMIPHFNFNPFKGAAEGPGGGSPASEVAESVDEWYDELCRQGMTGEQAAEVMRGFEADLAKAESSMGNTAAGVEELVDQAAGRVFSNPGASNSWGLQLAADVASNPASSAAKVADSLLKAGVPSEALESTVRAVEGAIRAAPQGWIGRPAFNAALGVISSSVTDAGMAASEAAKAAVNGATGPGLAWSLGPAGVPPAAADAAAEAVTEAVRAAKAAGADPVVAAINAISKAASRPGLAAAAAYDGASGSALAPALSAAGVPPDALDATAESVALAIAANRHSASGALSAAADIIASASSPAHVPVDNSARAVSPAQAALDALGASYNFWRIMPWLIWDAVNKAHANATDPADKAGLEMLIAYGPPPPWSSKFTALTYRRGGNRVTPFPSLPTDAPRPSHNGTSQNATQPSGPASGPTPPGIYKNTTQPSGPTLGLASPGTGGYLYDGSGPAAPARG